jgi:hypothetical protein
MMVAHNGDGGRCSSTFSSSSTEFVGMGLLGQRCNGAELQDLLVVPWYQRWEHLCRWKAKAKTARQERTYGRRWLLATSSANWGTVMGLSGRPQGLFIYSWYGKLISFLDSPAFVTIMIWPNCLYAVPYRRETNGWKIA